MLDALWQVQEARSKGQRTVWFHLHGNLEDYHVDILEKAEL